MVDSMILPTYPGKICQTSPNPHKERNSFRTVCEGSGVSSRSMWVRSYTIVLSNSKVIGLEWITHMWIPYLPPVAIYSKQILRPSQPMKNARESQNIKIYSNDIFMIIGDKFNLDSHFLWNIAAYSCRCPLAKQTGKHMSRRFILFRLLY